jgi:hypothetical protein
MPRKKSTDEPTAAELAGQLQTFLGRPVVKGLSARALRETPDAELVRKVADFVDHKIGRRSSDAEFKKLPPAVRSLYAIFRVNNDVLSGGFDSFFEKRAAKYAEEALAGFQRIGAPELAEVMAAAIALERKHLKKHGPVPEGTPIQFYRRGNPSLSECDQAFVQHARALRNQMVDFVRSHVGEFICA